MVIPPNFSQRRLPTYEPVNMIQWKCTKILLVITNLLFLMISALCSLTIMFMPKLSHSKIDLEHYDYAQDEIMLQLWM